MVSCLATEMSQGWYVNPDQSGASLVVPDDLVDTIDRRCVHLSFLHPLAVVLEKTLESPLDCKEIQPVHPKGDQSWEERLILKLKLQYFGHLM